MRHPRELLIASRNAGKLREVEPLLASLPLRLRNLAEFPGVRDVEETGATFEQNAALKAVGYAAQAEHWTLADDSGLEVDALGGAPGVFSARYAGAGASDAERVRKLLEELARTGDCDRSARFVCVIAIADQDAALVETFRGVCEGRLSDAARGEGGFGYDPIFIPDGFAETFGELPVEIKQSVSHRARALAQARVYLRQRFGGD